MKDNYYLSQTAAVISQMERAGALSQKVVLETFPTLALVLELRRMKEGRPGWARRWEWLRGRVSGAIARLGRGTAPSVDE